METNLYPESGLARSLPPLVTPTDPGIQGGDADSEVDQSVIPLIHVNKDPEREDKLYRVATVKVFYYAIAASFAAILSGCTLGFPSSAILDLKDSETRSEYKFDGRLSDVFGVRR